MSLADILNARASQPDSTQASNIGDLLAQRANQTDSTQTIPSTEQSVPQPSLIDRLKRQVGLTGRYALEGIGGMADALDAPLRVPMGVQSGIGTNIANSLGLPSPETPTEKVVGDASRMVVGATVPIGIGSQLVNSANAGAKALGGVLTANPVSQLASAAAGGASGGLAQQSGAGPMVQTAAALAGGLVAPLGVNAVTGLKNIAVNKFGTVNPLQVTASINNALDANGMTFSDISPAVANSLKNDVTNALKTNGTLDQSAVKRLVDYRLTGLTPTQATLTRDPAIWTQQQNTLKIGANSKDLAAQQLGQVANTNNTKLISNLNDLGASTATDPIGASQQVIGALQGVKSANELPINQAYQAARDTQGRAGLLDPYAFTQKANDLLDNSLLGGKLPSDVRGLLNKTATGEMPLTVDTAEQFKSRLGDLQRSSIDGSERKAIGLVRQALDDTPLVNDNGMGQQSIDAFNQARGLNRAWRQTVETTPALQAIEDNVQPDKFMNDYVIGNGKNATIQSVTSLKNQLNDQPQAQQAIRGQITSWLKDKALNGNTDELGRFSGTNYNKALDSIGDRKLNLFFTPDEVSKMKSLGRVASYEQVEPVGSAVNHSNTGGAMSKLLDILGNSGWVGKIPMGKSVVGDPAQNILVGRQANQALNTPNSLLSGVQPKTGGLLGISPALLASGSLLSP